MNGLFKEAAKAFPKLNPTERQTIKPGPAVDAIASISLILKISIFSINEIIY